MKYVILVFSLFLFTQRPMEAGDLSLGLPVSTGWTNVLPELADPLSLALYQKSGLSTAELSQPDTSIHGTKLRLLPENMSFMERTMWGEEGILRGIGIASPLTPEVRKHELDVRRTMLTAHQIGGFVTLGLMGASLFTGQRYLNNNRASDLDLHQTLVTVTILSYGTTAMLSVFSPPPLIRRDEVSTTTIHKTLAWVHFAGMIITPLLGKAILQRGPGGRYVDIDRAHYHQIAAYITTAVFAASLIVVTF